MLPAMRIVVLGAGLGGLELASILSDAFGDALVLVLVDHGEGFVFGSGRIGRWFGEGTARG